MAISVRYGSGRRNPLRNGMNENKQGGSNEGVSYFNESPLNSKAPQNTNSINPYWEVGNLHNDGLDYVIKNLNPSEHVTIEKVIKLVCQYMQVIENTSAKLDIALYYEFIATTINRLNQTSFEDFLKEAKISKAAIYFLNEIQNISTNIDYPTTVKILTTIETDILNSNMTEQEKQLPLISVAVAKSSVEYWIKQINDPKSVWVPFFGGAARASWPWKTDAKAAAVGFLTAAGNAAFNLLPGPFTSVGVFTVLMEGLVGGLAAGLGASATAALHRLLRRRESHELH